MMKFAVTVGAGGDGVVHFVRAAIREASNVMNFQEGIAMGMLEWRREFTYLTDTIRP